MPVERVARQPDQLRLMEPEFPCLFQLFAKFVNMNHVREAHVARSIDQGKRRFGRSKALPDELEHEQLVEIGIQQGPRDRVQFPVMIMSAPREIDDHDGITLLHAGELREMRHR